MMPGPKSLYARRVKRGFDIAGSAALIVATAPAHIVCSLAIIVTSGRPVYFRQQRVGIDGSVFELRKFRTMLAGTESRYANYPTAAAVTPVGRYLRRFSLDELPQLLNIASGQMSFIGPRPALADQVNRYSDEQRIRLTIRPGLTGLAQIRHRNSAPWSKRIVADLEYIRKLSIGLDAKILILTIPSALRGEGQVIGQTVADVDDLGEEVSR